MNSDGSNQLRLTRDPGVDGQPVWSPNGNRIAFSSRRPSDFDSQPINYEISTVSAQDGSGPVTNLTYNVGADFLPDWQPIVN